MDGVTVALIVFVLLSVIVVTVLLIRKYGVSGLLALLRSVPSRVRGWLSTQRGGSFTALDGGTSGRRRRAMTTANVESIPFATYRDDTHGFSLQYPDAWTVVRSDTPNASIIVQIACNAQEETYKRVSVAWDDVSWSSITAESFVSGMVEHLPQLVPGSQLVSCGFYNRSARADGAYELVYRLADAMDGSESQLQNVVVVSTHAGRRRAYTITFGTDVGAFPHVSRLARYIIDSFRFEDGNTSPGRAGSDEDGGVHINVWERERTKMLSDKGAIARRPAAVAGPLVPTAAAPADVSWTTSMLPAVGLQFVHPASWTNSGITQDESLGFSPLATHSIRRWCIAFTCDRREDSFKHMSIISVDITPCYELLQARLSKNPRALDGVDAGTLLLTYVAYRYRSELSDAAAAAAGSPPQAPMLTPTEECLRTWSDAFAQRWPPVCKVSTPQSNASAADVTAPTQIHIMDQRVVGSVRLWKVAGWLRTASSSTQPAPSASPEMHHRGSTYSSASVEHEHMQPEGQHIDTVSAVLFRLHDAEVQLAAAARARGVASAAVTARRYFADVITFSAAKDVYSRFEPLARYAFEHANPLVR